MKSLWKKEEEREKVKEKEPVGGRDPEAHEGEDGPGDDRGGRFPPPWIQRRI